MEEVSPAWIWIVAIMSTPSVHPLHLRPDIYWWGLEEEIVPSPCTIYHALGVMRIYIIQLLVHRHHHHPTPTTIAATMLLFHQKITYHFARMIRRYGRIVRLHGH